MKEKIVLWGIATLPIIFFLVLMALKLTNTIAWSWWLVTFPLWIPIAVPIIAGLVVTAYVLRWLHKQP